MDNSKVNDTVFQSTLPSQGATSTPCKSHLNIVNFNPRSPHRERQRTLGEQRKKFVFQSTLPSQGATLLDSALSRCKKFQSTLPSQGATNYYIRYFNMLHISIHAPLTGSDCTLHR